MPFGHCNFNHVKVNKPKWIRNCFFITHMVLINSQIKGPKTNLSLVVVLVRFERNSNCLLMSNSINS